MGILTDLLSGRKPVQQRKSNAPLVATNATTAPTIRGPWDIIPLLPRRTQNMPFVCWRWWRCVVKDGEPFLQSTYRDAIWEGPIMHAHARPDTADAGAGIYGHFLITAPSTGEDCICINERGRGMYGYGWEPKYKTVVYPIAGEIELIGNCVVHADGVRGEHARVRRLIVYPRYMPFCRPETLTQLANRYDCPVEAAYYYKDIVCTSENQ